MNETDILVEIIGRLSREKEKLEQENAALKILAGHALALAGVFRRKVSRVALSEESYDEFEAAESRLKELKAALES